MPLHRDRAGSIALGIGGVAAARGAVGFGDDSMLGVCCWFS